MGRLIETRGLHRAQNELRLQRSSQQVVQFGVQVPKTKLDRQCRLFALEQPSLAFDDRGVQGVPVAHILFVLAEKRLSVRALLAS